MLMDECRNPAVLLNTRTLRTALGFAGALSGSACSTFSIILGSIGFSWAGATSAVTTPNSSGRMSLRMRVS